MNYCWLNKFSGFLYNTEASYQCVLVNYILFVSVGQLKKIQIDSGD